MKEATIHGAYYLCVAVPVGTAYGLVSVFVGEREHPFNSWYPFESKNTDDIIFFVTGSYEIICLIGLAVWHGATDVFLFLLIGMMYYQTRLLGYRLTQLGWAKTKYTAEEQNNNFKQLLECVRLRREINESVLHNFSSNKIWLMQLYLM